MKYRFCLIGMKRTQLFCLVGPAWRSFLDADEFYPNLKKVISILEKFCNDWLLSINPKKTKDMVFQQKCRKSTQNKYCFHINDNSIEIVNNYTYLGVNFSSTGTLRDYKTVLKEKTRRSIFATRRYRRNFTKLPLAFWFPLSSYFTIWFRSWGAYSKDNFSTREKDEIEKTHSLHIFVNKL